MGRLPEIHIVCVTPPPVTGMTTVTQAMAARLAEHHQVVGYGINRPEGMSNRLWSLTKHLRLIAAAFKASIRMSRADYAYMTPDSGHGLIGSLVMLAVLRALGRNVIMHHHVFSYLNETTAVSRLFFGLARRGVRHLVLCRRMKELMQSRYGGGFDVNVHSNSSLVPAARVRPERSSVQTIGYLSNISLDKGIDTFLDAATELTKRYPALKVQIAGPCASDEVRSMLDAFVAQDTTRRSYLGAIYGEEKERFFVDVDVLLFPTRYRNEAEPLVIFEAARYGTVVFARDMGCICEQIDDVDLVIPVGADFTDLVCSRIEGWISEPEKFRVVWLKTEKFGNPPPPTGIQLQ